MKLGFAAEDVFAEKALGIGVCYCLLHDLDEVAIFAAQIDEAHLRADSEAGDDGAFDDRVGVVQEDEVVFAGAGLGLVSVDQNIFGFGGLLWDERPFQAGGEACAAAAAEAGGFHLVDDPVGAFGEGFFGGLVAAQLDVAIDVGRSHAEALGDDLDFVGMGYEPRHLWTLPLLCSWPILRLPCRW